MQTFSYLIRFVAPAFLGNADQDGQWRTPSIKALLRQWWRSSRTNCARSSAFAHCAGNPDR
jgi:CRISPR/Cas system CMR-associated protein Cmr1 (group 7 of RAMP superfamily)